jgi:hypothetical protein
VLVDSRDRPNRGRSSTPLKSAASRRKEKPRPFGLIRCEVTRSGVGSSHPAHHEWRPADFGRVRKARWDAVEANCRTLEGMARPAGSAGAQVAEAAGAGRGDIGSGLRRQQAGSLAFGGLRARLEKPQALIALLRRLAPLPIAAGFVIAPRLCEPRGRSDCAQLQSTHVRLNPECWRWTTSGSPAGDDGCVTVLLLRGKRGTQRGKYGTPAISSQSSSTMPVANKRLTAPQRAHSGMKVGSSGSP